MAEKYFKKHLSGRVHSSHAVLVVGAGSEQATGADEK
jgi:hypothetical protein